METARWYFFCDLEGLSPLPPSFPSQGGPGVQSRVKGDLTATCLGKWAPPRPSLRSLGELQVEKVQGKLGEAGSARGHAAA